jgi:hypothetical protein
MTDRAVSVTVSYALNLAIATVVIAGVLTATGGVVSDQRRNAAQTELQVVGQRLAADIGTADRLATAGGETVVVTSNLPDRIAGVQYSVTVSGSDLVLEASHSNVVVRVPFRTKHEVVDTTVAGGDVTIVVTADDAGDGDDERELEVRG